VKYLTVMESRHFSERETFVKTGVKTRDKPRHYGLGSDETESLLKCLIWSHCQGTGYSSQDTLTPTVSKQRINGLIGLLSARNANVSTQNKYLLKLTETVMRHGTRDRGKTRHTSTRYGAKTES